MGDNEAADTVDTSREDVTIAGLIFSMTNPYAPGHVCTAGEASQLNQVRHENLRNNFAAKVRAAVEAAETAGTDVDTATLQAELDEYDSKYQMGVRQRGAGGGRVVDPVAREARSIAKDMLNNALKKKGKKVGDLSAELLKEKIDEILAKYPNITEAAKQRVAERQAIAEQELDDIAA